MESEKPEICQQYGPRHRYHCSRILNDGEKCMSANTSVRERRGNTRIRLKLEIEVKGTTQPFDCEGETHVVNLHGSTDLDIWFRCGST
jgi:hypothetical protein